MHLHHDKYILEELITATAEELGIDAFLVEKDYYVTVLLKELVTRIPDMVFKGGSSLSKCYRLIDRFSEDIDISFNAESGKPGESRKKKLKKAIVESIEAIGLKVSNIDETRSRRDYNCYKAPFPSLYTNSPIVNSEIIVETYVALLPFPTQKKNVENYIHVFLQTTNQEYLAEKYGLSPFSITTQSISRTFIDKVFAVCDYYMTNHVDKHSRHLYDIHKIYTYPEFKVDSALKQLIEDVRIQRERLEICPSAQEHVNVGKILEEIVSTSAYAEDYHKITDKILFSSTDYDEAIESIKDIVKREIFSKV